MDNFFKNDAFLKAFSSLTLLRSIVKELEELEELLEPMEKEEDDYCLVVELSEELESCEATLVELVSRYHKKLIVEQISNLIY